MRLRSLASVVIMVLGSLWLAAAPADAETWSKVDCAGTHLGAPAGIQADCYQAAPNAGGTASCSILTYQIALPANVDEPHFFGELRQPASPKCSVQLPRGPVEAMQHQSKFVNDEATNWSTMQALDADTNIMFFDAKNQKKEGKCFAFAKLGPSVVGTSGGHAYWLVGYFCKRPGQPLDAAAANALIKAIQIKS